MFCKRCNCRKHLRWTQNGKPFRRKAGVRSWAAAEEKKRELETSLQAACLRWYPMAFFPLKPSKPSTD
jgi:hypothetical protein